MIDSYITVSGPAREEIVVNKSRFIGYVTPCTSESEALSFLQSVRDEHRTAKHHCYAYIIGENSGVMRYSDDGEPGGTAGMPIMDVMRTKGIVNCCIVVVRYFGGVLLGTGGLVRAYTSSAKLAVEAAGVCSVQNMLRMTCETDYTYLAKFQKMAVESLKDQTAFAYVIGNVEYGEKVTLELVTFAENEEELRGLAANLTSGSARITTCSVAPEKTP